MNETYIFCTAIRCAMDEGVGDSGSWAECARLYVYDRVEDEEPTEQ
jgi:hypothetical protein